MLHEFLSSNRQELITRCRAKRSKRNGPAAESPDPQGIPVFLEQLADTLRLEAKAEEAPEGDAEGDDQEPGETAVGRSASRHGAELLRLGFTVDQVVHEYGDVCQAVTELAIERESPVSTDEFRTLNRCLDNAIADAVSAFARQESLAATGEEKTFRERLEALPGEHRRLVDIAIKSFAAIRTGNIGATGATGALLLHALNEMQVLVSQLGSKPGTASIPPPPPRKEPA